MCSTSPERLAGTIAVPGEEYRRLCMTGTRAVLPRFTISGDSSGSTGLGTIKVPDALCKIFPRGGTISGTSTGTTGPER
jgi:hypothetical protein